MRYIIEKLTLVLDSATLSDVDLSWNSMGEINTVVRRYAIYRSAGGAAYTFQGYSTTLSYNDLATMQAGVTYTWYAVCEYVTGAFSVRSNYVSALINTEYIYAIGDNEHIYTIDIRSRLVPSLAGDQDFSATFVGSGISRAYCSDTLFFAQNGGYVYCFDWLTNKTSLIHKSKVPSANDIQGMIIGEPKTLICPWVRGFETWDFTDPVNPTRTQQATLGGPTSGAYHYDGFFFDPTSGQIGSMYGDGNFTSTRWWTALSTILGVISTGNGLVQPDGLTTLVAESRNVVQVREPSSRNILWVLLQSNGWRGIQLPLVNGSDIIGTFSIDGNPGYSSYGRCYMLQNRYMVMCRRTVTASTYGVVIWDVNNPLAPVLLSNLGPLNHAVADICIVEDGANLFAYLIPRSDKIVYVVDVTNLAAPSTVGTVTLSGLSNAMAVASAYKTIGQRTGYNMATTAT